MLFPHVIGLGGGWMVLDVAGLGVWWTCFLTSTSHYHPLLVWCCVAFVPCLRGGSACCLPPPPPHHPSLPRLQHPLHAHTFSYHLIVLPTPTLGLPPACCGRHVWAQSVPPGGRVFSEGGVNGACCPLCSWMCGLVWWMGSLYLYIIPIYLSIISTVGYGMVRS